jgi:hypothetical protein
MSGHVFHPGHHALHGITVVLDTTGPLTYVGRFDTQDDGGVHLLDVAVHDRSDATSSREEFLRRTLKFGVPVTRKQVMVPSGDVATLVPLSTVGA